MKKKLVLSTLLLPFLCLTSCGSTNKIVIPQNLDIKLSNSYSAFEVDTEHLLNLFNNDHTFILYLYSPNCGYCNYVSGYFENISYKNYMTLYKYNVADNIATYPLLSEYDSSYFSKESAVTPRVLFIDNGDIYVEMNSTKFNDKNLFSSTLNAFSKIANNIYNFTSISSLEYILSLDEYLLISYNSNKDYKVFNENIYPLFVDNPNKDFYIFDTSYLNETTTNYLKNELNISNIDNIYFTKEKLAKDYSESDNLNELINYISL